MNFVVLSFIDSDVDVPLVGVCSYPQYDTPLQDIKHALADFLNEASRLSNDISTIATEATGELWYTITIRNNETPPDTANSKRVVNRLMFRAHDYFYKEDPNAATSG